MSHAPGNAHYDLVVLGAGASGLMCAAVAGARGLRVLVLEKTRQAGRKILLSGGGRCNFTNRDVGPEHYLCRNPHFVKSALSRYTPWDFLALVERHGIPYHEREHGRLFCDRSARDIVRMLLAECADAGVEIRTRAPAVEVHAGPPHQVVTPAGMVTCDALAVATGGCSFPTTGTTGFGLDLARQLGLPVQPPRPGLVPLTLEGRALERIRDLSGIALKATVRVGDHAFTENLLFTHRGLSGPAVLQASSYWRPGEPVAIDLFPGMDLEALLDAQRRTHPRRMLQTLLARHLTRRVARCWCSHWVEDQPLGQMGQAAVRQVVSACQSWTVWPAGTEGYGAAEVTVGGVDTDAVSSKTLACHDHPGIHFIGETLDVTGQLGGYNFQWAWTSGHAAGSLVGG
ncbi:NAD(P)/FAD-dependent oxidoreductase [Ectothiorhodospira mobilis]|uniref:NAD(P)/FAD-dependent oxidoreductase n=1 Tax=Ectothiorhodospira mobilis TaxID=195064 RepID=UPI003083F8F6